MPNKKYPSATVTAKYYDEINEMIQFLCNRSRNLTFTIIEEATGIPATWLSMFARGKIDDPSYVRFSLLRDYLANLNI